jgi:hypothetical protein
MGDYWKWQQEGGPVVRVHSRVIAGLARENADEFHGILLGTVSPQTAEVVVEDFARLPDDGAFDPLNGLIAGQKPHSLPAVGYFRYEVGAGLRLTQEDRERFRRDFPGPLHVLMLFQGGGGNVRWADAYVQPEPGNRHRDLTSAAPTRAAPRADEEAPRRSWRRFASPMLAIGAGFLIGVIAYLALRGDPRQDAHVRASTSAPRAQSEVPPVAPPLATAPLATAPAPAPKADPSEADRIVDPGGAKAVIRSVLDRWSSALLHNDLDGYVSLYAPSVGPYFNDKRASRAQVADEVRRSIARHGAVTMYKISDVNIEPVDENHATATFRKQWRTVGNAFSGDEKAQLGFERQHGNWVITSEKELKVYSVHRK